MAEKLPLLDCNRGQKSHCFHGLIINQENKLANNNTSELV